MADTSGPNYKTADKQVDRLVGVVYGNSRWGRMFAGSNWGSTSGIAHHCRDAIRRPGEFVPIDRREQKTTARDLPRLLLLAETTWKEQRSQ